MTKANYHTHTYRCKHAKGDVADYCRAAIAAGLEVLGISDHTPLPDDRWLNVRMEYAQLPDYCRAMDEAAAEFDELTLLRSAECEYDDGYHGYYQNELLGECNFDYLIGAVHYVPYHGEWIRAFGALTEPAHLVAYAEYFIRSMESGLFSFMAHPDVFGNVVMEWDENVRDCSKDMLQAAEELNMPLEINGYGFRKPNVTTPTGERDMYPWREFWELASEYDIRVLSNSDAHRPEDIVAGIAKAESLADELGLKRAQLNFGATQPA